MTSSRCRRLWAPSSDDVNARFGAKLKTYDDLHKRSTESKSADQFWLLLFEFLQIKSDRKPAYAIRQNAVKELPLYPPPQFFLEIKLNFTENILSYFKSREIVLHVCSEGAQNIRNVTAMVVSGIGVGDRVATIISTRQETIACCLATLSLGAIWSTSSPDMGVDAVLSRLTRIRPKMVFCESEVLYNDKKRGLMEKIKKLEHVVGLSPERSFFPGTSGPPKCIVHSAGGLLLQVRKDVIVHYDVRPGDTVLQYTTTGWITWATVLVSLSYGGKVVVYDGSPFVLDELVLLRLISPKFLTYLKIAKINPRDYVDLSSLRTFCDYGFPENVHLHSTCGGTDPACWLITGNSTAPLYAGEIQCPSLGMAIDILSMDESQPTSVESTGELGELTCLRPFPSQPVPFWGDKDGDRYRNSYFEKFDIRVWNQGDLVSVNPRTGDCLSMVDQMASSIRPAFASEVRRSIMSYNNSREIRDNVCVGQQRSSDNDEHVVLFVRMAPANKFSNSFCKRIRREIGQSLSQRHVPRYIFEVPDIPYTINEKRIEILVKHIISGKSFKVTSTIQNPKALYSYQRFMNVEEVDAQQKRRWKKAML
ncbi:acetyl-CoA synthetase-like protein [Zopfia rhizophila CBS 207.26]|uniref:Acetyl-CoA synthetase-like protein n=1 Tax=Zopfia rhizophila CBS 207.26 TaxID=1314779 RepID=A0A6A6E7Q1_9PEZI|nr:acetyl-CoA synthetase-like protein [Zopfia rhizophila CBS 207.26]